MIGGKGKLNVYMLAKEKARKANKPSFEYKGCTYKQMKMKTGMITYKKVVTNKCPAPIKKKRKKKSKKN